MSFEEYVRGPKGRLRSFSSAPFVPRLKYPEHMDRAIGEFALDIANELTEKADVNACGSLAYNYAQEREWDNDFFTGIVTFAVDVAVMTAHEERSTDLLRNIRKIVENTCTIWRAKMAIKFQSKLDDRELTDRELRSAKDVHAQYEQIADQLENFMRSRYFDEQLDDLGSRGSRGRGRDDDRYSRGRDDRGRGRDDRYGDRDDRGGRDRGRDDRSGVRGFGRDRSSSSSSVDGGVREDRFAAAERGRDDRDDRQDQRVDPRNDQGNKPAQTGQNKQIHQTPRHVFPNVPTLELDENMKREDHELLPAGTADVRTAEVSEIDGILHNLFKTSNALGESNEYYRVHDGYIVDTDVPALQKTAQSQFMRALLQDPKINTHVTYGCALNPMLGLSLDLDPERVTTLKQFRSVYLKALGGTADQRMAASALRQLDHMLTDYVNQFILQELNIEGLRTTSYFNDGSQLALYLMDNYSKPASQQYIDFEERLLTFLSMQEGNLLEEARTRIGNVVVANVAETDTGDVPFFIAPLMYSFMHLNVYQDELKIAKRPGVQLVDPKRTPLIYSRMASTGVNKMRTGMRTLVDYMIDLDGNMYRWFESASDKGTYYIVAL